MCPFIVQSLCCLEETNSGSQRKIVSRIRVEGPSSSQHCQKEFDKDESPPQNQKICT
jgi:hypothetical protein